MGNMTASPTNANDTARVLEEASEWKALVDSAAMSEKQRLEFRAWLDEPRNRRALGEVQALVTIIQALPENKAAALRKQRLPLRSIELDRGGILTRPLSAMTVAATAVSAGASAFGLSATLVNFVEDLFWSGSSPSTAMPSGAAFAVCCAAGVAGSIGAALFFRRAMRN
jgi:ferric-dicitrate binding protein FerR (iron transport regulator)